MKYLKSFKESIDIKQDLINTYKRVIYYAFDKFIKTKSDTINIDNKDITITKIIPPIFGQEYNDFFVIYNTPEYLNDVRKFITELKDDELLKIAKHYNDKFRDFNFQKKFLEENPGRYEDLSKFGYADGIKELFPHIFSAHDFGL